MRFDRPWKDISPYYMDFVVSGNEALRLAEAIAEYTQAEVHPLGFPVTAYSTDQFIIETSGIVTFEDAVGIEGLLEVLVDKGFVSMNSNLGCEE